MGPEVGEAVGVLWGRLRPLVSSPVFPVKRGLPFRGGVFSLGARGNPPKWRDPEKQRKKDENEVHRRASSVGA